MQTKMHFIAHALMLLVMGMVTACSSERADTAKTLPAPTPSAYRGLLDGEIRGIDAVTIDNYLSGNGMGLALPAELNGYPGPRHVLDLANELGLTSEQEGQIQTLYDEMQAQAVALGEQILSAEAALEADFRAQIVNEENLSTQLQNIGILETELRFVHLRTHLAAIDILTPHQVMLYNSLRGYEEMPANHDQHQHGG